MDFNSFLKAHLITGHLFPPKDKYTDVYSELLSGTELVDCIVDVPRDFVGVVLSNGCYISQIIWWDRARISAGSDIGAGGYRDPWDPDYYFAEITFLDKEFDLATSEEAYLTYMQGIWEEYPNHTLYPGFCIVKK